MKSWFWKRMLAAAIALPALSGVARADDFGCSNATLNGEYAFGVTSYTSNYPPTVVAGVKFFDGEGNLTQRDYAGNSVPAQFSPTTGRPRLHRQHGDPLERACDNGFYGPYQHPVCDQRRRTSHS
jgi:hypothetical protein